MPFVKGDENINRLGRPAGSKNKYYTTRRFIFNGLVDNRDKFMHELKTLKGEKFVSYYMKLLEFVVAKRNNQIIKVDKLSDKEIQDLLESIN
tara:strand:+ start:282 stop:557 length:276 start_codon:yes stop_codon:yes gene_type:complete